MSLKNILHELTKGVWMLEPNVAQAYMPLVNALLNNDTAAIEAFLKAEIEAKKESFISEFSAFTFDAAGRVQGFKSFDDAPPGSVSVVPIKGVMMKNDWCGSPGTQTLSSIFKAADQHPNIIGHLSYNDSGGGSVDGTKSFADIISSLQKSSVAFVNGISGSANYWTGSAHKEIIASSATDMIGCIGTMLTLRDNKGAMEQQGIRMIEVYASQSPDKNKAFRDAIAGNDSTLKAELLDPLNELFLSAVKNNRGDRIDLKKENILSGKIYLAQDAVSNGAIDAIGDFEFALNRVKELSSTTTTHSINFNQNSSTMKINLKAAWTALIADFGATVPAGADSVDHETTPEKLAELNTKLETLAGLQVAKDKAESDLAAAKVAQDAAALVNATTIEALTASVNDWKAKAIEYGAKSGDDGKRAVKAEADKIESDKKDPFATFEHNKVADDYTK